VLGRTVLECRFRDGRKIRTPEVPHVRAWAGRDSYNDRAGEAFAMLAINFAVIAAVLWVAATLPRAALLAIIVIGIQAAFTYQAWRRARGLSPR
jgi:hypothetical protein